MLPLMGVADSLFINHNKMNNLKKRVYKTKGYVPKFRDYKFKSNIITKIMMQFELSQAGLARCLSLSASTLSKIRSGKTPMTKRVKDLLSDFVKSHAPHVANTMGYAVKVESTPKASTAGEALLIAVTHAVDEYLKVKFVEKDIQVDTCISSLKYYKGRVDQKSEEIKVLKSKLLVKKHLGVSNDW